MWKFCFKQMKINILFPPLCYPLSNPNNYPFHTVNIFVDLPLRILVYLLLSVFLGLFRWRLLLLPRFGATKWDLKKSQSY